MRRVALVMACAIAAPALADPKVEAKAHMEAAAVAYKEGRFEDTLAELNKAYAKDPRPELHYSIGQVYVKLGRCSDAIVAYENFLASKPSRERTDLANQAIATCREQLSAQLPTTPTPPPVDPAAQPAGPDTEPAPGVQPTPAATTATIDTTPAWYKDKLGLGLTAGGAVLTVVGLALYSGARGKIQDAEDADDYGTSQALYDDAQSQRTTSMVIVTLGLAATGVGVWRLWKKRTEEQQRTMAFVPFANGGLITYSGGF